jgi:hypothetical protein
MSKLAWISSRLPAFFPHALAKLVSNHAIISVTKIHQNEHMASLCGGKDKTNGAKARTMCRLTAIVGATHNFAITVKRPIEKKHQIF